MALLLNLVACKANEIISSLTSRSSMEAGAATPEATVATSKPAGTTVVRMSRFPCQAQCADVMSYESHEEANSSRGNRRHAPGPQTESTGQVGNDT